MEQPHKRRVRYSGTHPRRFQDKYKELNPEKYQDQVEKILRSGKTPAGMHVPIMVKEILEVLQIQPGQTGYDATLGYGGHTRKMLEQLQGSGHLYATDIDPIESEKTKTRLAALGYGEEILTIRRMNFAQVDQLAPGVLFDFVLADLGVWNWSQSRSSRNRSTRAMVSSLSMPASLCAHGPAQLRGAGAGVLEALLGRRADHILRNFGKDSLAGILPEGLFHQTVLAGVEGEDGGPTTGLHDAGELIEKAVQHLELAVDVDAQGLDEIMNEKVTKNEAKYPVEKARGRAEKYTEL